MSSRHILYITSDGLRWFRLKSGRAELFASFDTGEAGQQVFAARLAEVRETATFAVLVDVADEAFHVDVVPAVSGSDRRAMLNRKLAQHFYGNTYTAATSLGREKTGRRDERILFAAVTRQAVLEPWIDALTRTEARVSGVHSVPLLLDRMLERKRSGFGRCLLINLTPAGLRQSFLDQGRLRFSRLTAHHDGGAGLLKGSGSDEIRKTHAYLTGQRLLARGEPVDVVVMAGEREFEILAGQQLGTDELRLVLAPCSTIAARLKLPAPSESGDSLPLLLSALDREADCLHLGSQSILRFHRIHFARRAVFGAAAVVLVAGLLFSGKLWLDSIDIRGHADLLRQRAADQDVRYRELIGSLPPLPAPLEQLRTLIDDIDRLESLSIPAIRILQPLSRALENEPELTLVRVRWQIDQSSASATTTAADWAADTRVIATADLRLPDYLEGDQRGMIELSERFSTTLTRYAGDTVRIVRLPIDLQSSQTLRGREGREALSDRPAALEIQYVLKGPGKN
ncbi:hypothetical protein [Cognatazoarcus halotolerans]|uniref:hypothetical protein n=1 Tax=Cognatazoarcus halotolerans TaxID=2686016 RepID=UPI00135ACD18|nr:hypothetical protein [Cognatazoarcus halotolerans]MBX3678616.1 hypothetical protein [Rhodocyclaceae bacterium]MCB1899357.1 hypothetical protein [Rhodocyclaceae bacterium]MCP5308555.1 hypothetical protein [Zoogloeaceae bacterium]